MSELLESAEAPKHGLGLSKTSQELVAGTVGGIAQVLVGQPFDLGKWDDRVRSLPAES